MTESAPVTTKAAPPSPQPAASANTQSLSGLIWSVADLLRGDYKPHDYGKVILPFTVLRRLDCVLAPTKAAVLAEQAAKEAQGLNPEPFLLRLTGVPFANTSSLDVKRLMGDQDNIATNLASYIQGFSPAVRDVFDRFLFAEQIALLQKANLLVL
jgi:type I restriction enzyme M protein